MTNCAAMHGLITCSAGCVFAREPVSRELNASASIPGLLDQPAVILECANDSRVVCAEAGLENRECRERQPLRFAVPPLGTEHFGQLGPCDESELVTVAVGVVEDGRGAA